MCKEDGRGTPGQCEWKQHGISGEANPQQRLTLPNSMQRAYSSNDGDLATKLLAAGSVFEVRVDLFDAADRSLMVFRLGGFESLHL